MSSQVPETFGALLREARQRAGLSVTALAKHLGVSKNFVSEVERGSKPPFTTSRTLDVSRLLEMDSTALLQAAARHSGKYELPVLSEQHGLTAAHLVATWANLTPQTLSELVTTTLRNK